MDGWYVVVTDISWGQVDVLVRLGDGTLSLLRDLVLPPEWASKKKQPMCWPTKAKASGKANQFNMKAFNGWRQVAKAVDREELDTLMVGELLLRGGK